jgi:hypothetical protein
MFCIPEKPVPKRRALRRFIILLLLGEDIMTIEAQVAGLVAGQASQTTALQAIATQLTALQASVAAIPTTAVPPAPATTSPPDILAAVAALQTGVTTLLTDVTDPADATPASAPVSST